MDQKDWLNRIFEATPKEVEERAHIYFVSKFTFSPLVKDIVFDRLPAKLDRSIPGMLSVLSSNLRNLGSYYEKCYLIDPETLEEIIGGIPRSQVLNGEKYEPCRLAGF